MSGVVGAEIKRSSVKSADNQLSLFEQPKQEDPQGESVHIDRLVIPDGGYSIIYADPPWRYSGGKGENSKKYGNSLASYPCMKIEEMKAMPIERLAAGNCALFMWSTWPMIAESLDLIASWGFSYKTCAFLWIKMYSNKKPYCGMGYYTRSGSEFCLLATRGKMERQSNTVYQVFSAPVEGHSKKPDCVRSKIIDLFGNLPRVELFARDRVEGWVAWGNEV